MEAIIDESLSNLVMNINLLKSLPGNPRKGNVNAIKESYSRFGQLKPIVAVRDDEGGYTVIAGNHQLQAARDLGWESIAVAVVDMPSQEAIAFALTDNKVSELGSTDNKALIEMLADMDTESPLMDALGWDDFAVAAIENSVITSEGALRSNDGWVAPAIVTNVETPQPTQGVQPQPTQPTQVSPSGVTTATTDASTNSIVTQGSTATGMSGSRNAAIQYTLVFDSSEQQSKWYSFIRWLKMSPVYDGETTSEKLLDFIAAHSEEG